MAQIKKKIFLDANILFTAAYNPEGLAYNLIGRAKTLHLDIFTSEYAWEEARYNLSLKAPDALEKLEVIKNKMHIFSAELHEENNPFGFPLDDLPIFQAALQCDADYLLSGDKKAFGKWMNKPEKTLGLCICTVREFMDAVLS